MDRGSSYKAVTQSNCSIHISFLILFVCGLKADQLLSVSSRRATEGLKTHQSGTEGLIPHYNSLIWAGTALTACRARGGAEDWKEKPFCQAGSLLSSETAPTIPTGLGIFPSLPFTPLQQAPWWSRLAVHKLPRVRTQQGNQLLIPRLALLHQNANSSWRNKFWSRY